jgi:uncharacterized membrane protein
MKLSPAVLTLLAIAACAKDPRVAVTPGDEVVSPSMCSVLSSTCSTATPPSYQNVVAPIIRERCASCHTGIDNAPWALDNWADVAEWSDLIATSIDSCSMPPADAGVPFTEREREQVRTWAICGAPNN